MSVVITGGTKYKDALEKIASVRKAVKAGVPGNATTTDGKSIAEYALFNELGTSRMPARPFLRQTVAEKQTEWLEILAQKLNFKSIEKNNAEDALGLTGEMMMAHIKQTIQKGDFTPDAESTVKAKARRGKMEPNHPLIDTGQLLEHGITYEVTDL
jgi:hypothetical protein